MWLAPQMYDAISRFLDCGCVAPAAKRQTSLGVVCSAVVYVVAVLLHHTIQLYGVARGVLYYEHYWIGCV